MRHYLVNFLKRIVLAVTIASFSAVNCQIASFAEEAAGMGSAPANLNEIRIQANTVTLKTDKPVAYNVFKVGSPPRIVVELTNTEDHWKLRSVTLKNNKIFSRIRSGQFQDQPAKIARVVIELKSAVEFASSADGSSIVILAQAPGASDMQTAEVPAPREMAGGAAAPTPAELIPSEISAPEPAQPTEPRTQSAPKEMAAVNVPDSPNPAALAAPKASAPVKAELIKSDNEPSSLFGRQLVTLDFYDIDVRDLFKILGEKAGVNIVYGQQVAGTVSIQLRDVPFKDAVDTILALKNLKIVVMGKNILQVMTSEEFDTYRTRAISMTKVFSINYAKATDVNTQLTSILTTLGGKGKTMIDDRTNSIIVTDTPDGIDTTTKLIADLDKPTPQVMIEAKIVEVALGKNLDLGITWGVAYTDQSGNQMVTIGAVQQPKADYVAVPYPTPGHSGGVGLQNKTALNPTNTGDLESTGSGFAPSTGLGLSFGFVKDVVRLNAALSALQQKNKSKLLSNPKVATLNNQPATIKSQTSEPYITTEVSFSQGQSVTAQKVNTVVSGISLTVTPTINADGRITMKILPDVTSSQPTTIGVPKTTSQQANTTVIIKDGETFVIGGLISESESDARNYVPVLGSIPLLGHLFKKTSTAKRRSELLVFVTPRIIPF